MIFENLATNENIYWNIGAENNEDYWCEGNYSLSIIDNVIHAKRKCDEDDTNDFYIKFENEKYYIKVRDFLI